MSAPLPEPLPLFWPFKPLSSASAGVETLKDGRKKYWIKHDILKNVTPRLSDLYEREAKHEAVDRVVLV